MGESHLHTRELSRDIREVVELLGGTIREQSSQAEFDCIEEIRTTAIEYRTDERASRSAIRELLAAADPERKETIARAFSTYFAITNLAEERERVRQLRAGRQAGQLDDSIEHAVAALTGQGATAAELEQVMDDVLIEPTFTAHPTEARRKTVKSKLRTIAGIIEALDERRLADHEREQLLDRLDAEITTLWGTALVRERRPDVLDEAANVHWYIENVLFDVVPEIYDELDRALDEETDADVEVPKLYEFRSWAGSDRDGNPFVTPEITEETLERQRGIVLSLYRDRLAELVGRLSQHERQIEVGDRLAERIEARRERLPSRAAAVEEEYPNEPYRQFLLLMRESLSRVSGVRPGGYRDDAEFVADVEALSANLRDNGAPGVADEYVAPLLRQAQTFGFILAGLDLRDHQQQHTTAVEEALDREGIDYAGMDEDERVEFLTEAIMQDEAVLDLAATDGLSETADRVLTRFTRLEDWQREYGVQAIDTYAISMCEEPSHVLEVLFLADQAGVADLPDHAGLDIVPLLETESALSGARRIMGTLFENEAYASALDARDNVQEIMLGYSDSNKENGFLAANWSLHVNQKRLATITDEYDVEMRLFHGRGGSISRGGGPMNDALLALPRETVTGQVKFTEQGEAIYEKYANERIAERNLEQMLHAQLRARYDALEGPNGDEPERWHAAMETAADAGREAYRDLLDTEGFVEYFEQATPIRIIGDLNIGSRPASRSDDRSVEDLRAIPWVFSWTQTRCIIPGWYSLGAGLQAYLDEGGDLATLQEMYDGWPFFRSMLDNAALALARTELGIAEEYADLADPELRERFFPRLSAEYERTCDLVLSITGREHLADRSWLRERLQRRNPYVDPLNLLQVHLLRDDDRTDLENQVLRLTVKGIAAGMQNTG